MIQVSIYREKKSWILVKINKYYLQWNNWVQIIKMIKIQAANRNLPSVTALSNYLSLSTCTGSTRALSACASHALAVSNQNATCGLVGSEFNMLICFITSFLHIIFLSFSTTSLQWFNILKVTFNRLIVNGLIVRM